MKLVYLAVVATVMSLSGCVAEEATASPQKDAEEELTTAMSELTRAASIVNPDDRYQHYYYSVGGPCTFETVLFSLSDSELWLYGPNDWSRLVAYNDDSGGGLASRIQVTLGSGNYWVTVGGYGASTGSYQLDMYCGQF